MSVAVCREVRPEGGHLARLTIDNAAKLNSLDRALMAEIVKAAAGLAADPQLRLVIVTGAGERAFVGGADIGEIAALDRGSARNFITSVHHCCGAFRRLRAERIRVARLKAGADGRPALRILDEGADEVAGEMLADSFWLHKAAPRSSPLIHVSTSQRAEIVFFGEQPRLVPPLKIVAGEFTVTAAPGARTT